MEAFLASLVSVAFHGVAYGMILYVISVGLSVTMGLMGFTNLAHGVFAMAGGYILVSSLSRFHLPFPLALALSFVLVAAASIVLERLLYSRLYGASELEQVLFTIGLIFMSVAVARLIYGTLQQPVVLPEYLKGQFSLLGRDFPAYRVFLIVFSAAMIAALWFGVERTLWGRDGAGCGRQPSNGPGHRNQYAAVVHNHVRGRQRPRRPGRCAGRRHRRHTADLPL